ncbi:sodium-dependent phosphate transport protein 4 isoform X4 [Tamandua tetradactyla]|uniref:sodium-dependent phosphate transport protein 4 isoform X4 n=1 Tax=Tamandua tetradactyla TaxID=48850 RepID=UPI0040542AE9
MAYITLLSNVTLMAQNVIINITMVAMVNSTDHQSQVNGSTEGLPVDSFGGPNKAPERLPARVPTYDWSPQIQGIIFGSINYGVMLTLAPSGYLAGRGSGLGGQFALWEKWIPPHERSRLCTIALSGGIGCVCCILWFVLVYDDPVYHPWISTSEKEYIISSLVQEVSSSKKFLPIRAMSKSLPLWSMILCCFSHQWLITILMVYTPTYISSVYNVNIRDNGIFSAIPFFVAGVVGILGGQLADFLLTKSFRLITVRKMATVLGVLPSSALIVALPYLNSSCTTTVALLTISCGLTSLSQSGIYINALDIAPRHSSFLIGASRGFAYIAAILTPAISGYLLSQDPEFGWRNVFLLVFAINILGLIFFLIFGEANVQDWAKERKLTHL